MKTYVYGTVHDELLVELGGLPDCNLKEWVRKKKDFTCRGGNLNQAGPFSPLLFFYELFRKMLLLFFLAG
jgi:hypothetical protein